ncbi:RP439 family protein [Rickettsia endosymbiont of Orchestes rusci]|uniref:RP439 family protein n=1 Tax=Rickettsia endosymbiont of Orchestes rusci TaxID=3066250 RepID=UPI00313E181F
MFYINSKSVAHMLAQIRAKQLATKDVQDRLQKNIVECWEDRKDISGEKLVQEISEKLKDFLNTSNLLNDFLKAQDVNNIGYPIKFNKTSLQLDMAKKWVESQEEDVIGQIEKGEFYHKLTNDSSFNELPTLQSPSSVAYWGNENPSVSSILLASIAASYGIEANTIPGAATFYPFYNSNYQLSEDIKDIILSYPFATEESITLFGDYQFGGHRYFNEQLLFGPEDCSSSVGKATGLTIKQITGINTTEIRKAYLNTGNEYNYKPVTLLEGKNISDEQLKLIQTGDIYLYKSHTAIIASTPDNKSNITSVQFNRDIDCEENKLLGGGRYDYNLINKAQEDSNAPIYILRSSLEPLHESCALNYFVSKIDYQYSELYPNGPDTDIVGDCGVFFEESAVMG